MCYFASYELMHSNLVSEEIIKHNYSTILWRVMALKLYSQSFSSGFSQGWKSSQHLLKNNKIQVKSHVRERSASFLLWSHGVKACSSLFSNNSWTALHCPTCYKTTCHLSKQLDVKYWVEIFELKPYTKPTTKRHFIQLNYYRTNRIFGHLCCLQKAIRSQ